MVWCPLPAGHKPKPSLSEPIQYRPMYGELMLPAGKQFQNFATTLEHRPGGQLLNAPQRAATTCLQKLSERSSDQPCFPVEASHGSAPGLCPRTRSVQDHRPLQCCTSTDPSVQIFASAPARSIPRLATFSTSIGSSRQFGTTLKSHGRPMTQSSRLGLLPNSRVGAATLLSSQTISLASARRFASTGSEPEASPIVNSGLSSDLTGDLSTLESLASIDQLPQKVGYLSELGLDYGWGPTSLCQWAMEHAHFTAGMSWGWSILGVAVLMRVVMFYPTLLGQQESAKMQALRKDPIYNELTTQMWSVGSKGGLVSQEVAMARMQMVALEKRAGIKKIRMVYSFLQIPLTFGMFKLCRAMAALPVPGMESQGFWWFQDLTAADPLYILPCVSTAMLFLSIRVSLVIWFLTISRHSFFYSTRWMLITLDIVRVAFPSKCTPASGWPHEVYALDLGPGQYSSYDENGRRRHILFRNRSHTTVLAVLRYFQPKGTDLGWLAADR